jgi:alpha-ketoglutarate-dependent taurine dioxygenase
MPGPIKYQRLLESKEEKLLESLTPSSFVNLLDSHKAVLFRAAEDTETFSVDDFGDLVSSLKLKSYPYIGGAAPRRDISVRAGKNIVFTANESPADQPIPFHHELAQTADPPSYIFFFCDVSAQKGGETPIIDSTAVYRYASEKHPDFMAKLNDHGVRYTRVLTPEDDPSSPIGRSFYNTYNVKTIPELEAKLKATKGLDFEWLEGGLLKVTSEPIAGIRKITSHHGNAVYQNTFHNSIIAAFLGWQDDRNDRLKAVRFGNDEMIPCDVLESIAIFMEKNRVCHQWKKGEIMALNNRLVMHSRNPFEGARQVYASIWGDLDDDEAASIVKLASGCGKAIGSARAMQGVEDPRTFGFWQLQNPEEGAYQAISQGYRRLDSACDYGNEAACGRGIARAINDGICSRQDLHITSKLWNTYHHPDHVELAFERSLSDLGLDYMDEYLIHFPIRYVASAKCLSICLRTTLPYPRPFKMQCTLTHFHAFQQHLKYGVRAI